MAASVTNVVEFDPTSAAFENDPYAIYAGLRASDEFPWFDGLKARLVSRFADIQRIVMDPTMVRAMDGLFSEEEIRAEQRAGNWHDMPHHERFVQFSLLDSEQETHARLRKLVFSLFTPAAIAALRSSVQAFVDERLDALDGDEFDFVEDFAAAVPGHVIGRLLGVPKEDRARLRQWSENIVQFFDFDRSDERKRLAEETTTTFYRYLTALKEDRLEAPRDDLISTLAGHLQDGSLSEDEFISTCMLILMAGHGSTLDVLSTGMYNLLRFPTEMQRLRDDPGLIDTAVQEMFRFDSPLPFFHRYATTEVEFYGRRYPPGTKFGVLYGSANRDPAQFERPDEFDIGRKPNRHLAFGGGAHFCLGNHLARLNMDIVFTSLLRRFATIELAGEAPRYRPGLSVRGLRHLHIRVARA